MDKKNLRNDNKRILMTEQTEYISMNVLVRTAEDFNELCLFLTIELVDFFVQLDNKNYSSILTRGYPVVMMCV